ncbi:MULTISPECIES: histone-like nucleoid-structuring protein Lsr2 [unclassified Corynebacterium]|uniref:histone-like nucleoid-structuring protein Lsr2 n=1 Tax=unclassified Corynebacterium TaxID=2624378 RepID=UPI0030A35490
MARKEVIQYIDDIDGTQLSADNLRVVRFSVNNQNYVMDLSVENAEKFTETMKPYIDAASIDEDANVARNRRTTAGAASRRARERNHMIRKWARENGYQVADRGALPKNIIDAFDKA